MLKNSPKFHMIYHDTEDCYMHDMEIFVDVWGQLEISKLFSNYIQF